MLTSKTPSTVSLPSLVAIVGPTAVGKTEIALQVAERLGAEIVSADSRLFYRGMDIGTAKPSPAELARAPHHLIDVTTPHHTWSLTMFQQAAAEAIAVIHNRGKLPLLVGGTGQYIRAVLEGWQPPAQPPDARLRAALETWAGEIGGDALHARLAVLDPEAAGFIDARNVRRTIRALETILHSGERFSAQRGRSAPLYNVLMVGLTRPRPELYARIDARIQAMLEAGFLEEVRGLMESGCLPTSPALSAIGYREMAAVLRGEMTLDEAVVQIKRLTRRYVRQQGAWFREEDPTIHWFQADPNPVEAIVELIVTQLQIDKT